MLGHLHDDQARLEVRVIVLDFLHLQSFIIIMFFYQTLDLEILTILKSAPFSLTFFLRSPLTSAARSLPDSTVATILTR